MSSESHAAWWKHPILIHAMFLLPIYLVVIISFSPVFHSQFISIDDPTYLEQETVSAPFSWENIGTIMTHEVLHLYHPLTVLTLHLEHLAFGAEPAGYHVVNLVFHLMNIGVCYGIFLILFRSAWRSSLVAMLFAIHPLRVESVAWVVELKDVGSSLFALLSIWSYLAATRNRWKPWLAISFLCLWASVLYKPTYVGIPLIMLALDVWILGRWAGGPLAAPSETTPSRRSSLAQLLLEKAFIGLPCFLIVLTTVFPALFFKVGVRPATRFPLWVRLPNIPIAYFRYLYKMLDFRNLAFHYPMPPAWPWWQVAGATLLLLTITGFSWARRSRFPGLWIGWCWFVIAIAPVSGIVHISRYSLADRYTYLACLGPTAVAVLAIPEAWVTNRRKRLALAGSAVVVMITLGAFTYRQCGYWHDSMTLFQHSLDVEPDDSFVQSAVATGYYIGSQPLLAEEHFRRALELDPQNEVGRLNLTLLLLKAGRDREASEQAEQLLKISPDYGEGLALAAKIRFSRGDYSGSQELFERALRIDPKNTAILTTLGVTSGKLGDIQGAMDYLDKAISMDPDNALAHYQLALLLSAEHRYAEAERHYQESLKLDPNNADAHVNLGIDLVTQNRLKEAVNHLVAALKIYPDNADARLNLSIPLLKAGQFQEAARQCREAIRIRPDMAEAHFNLGEAMILLNQTDASIVEFKEVLRLRPDDPDAKRELDRALASKGSSGPQSRPNQ